MQQKWDILHLVGFRLFTWEGLYVEYIGQAEDKGEILVSAPLTAAGSVARPVSKVSGQLPKPRRKWSPSDAKSLLPELWTSAWLGSR